MDEIIKVNDVSMRFNLAQEKTETLKEYTVKLLTHKLFFNEFYALKHVSFSMKRGESLALIGRSTSKATSWRRHRRSATSSATSLGCPNSLQSRKSGNCDAIARSNGVTKPKTLLRASRKKS